MAAETSWHRYETKLRHCHPMYIYAVLFHLEFHIDCYTTVETNDCGLIFK